MQNNRRYANVQIASSDQVLCLFTDGKCRTVQARFSFARNFDNLAEANAFKNEKGKGVVVTKLGEPKACEYCPAFDICKQKDAYFAQGD